MIAQGHERVLIFEDDIRFEPFFVAKLENLLAELEDIRDKWDLVFLGTGTSLVDYPFILESR